MRMVRCGVLVALVMSTACGGGDDGGVASDDATADDGSPPDAGAPSQADAASTAIDGSPSTLDGGEALCGQPGDVGNELGVGKYCAGVFDCSSTQSAPLCSSLGDPDTHFCTRRCQAAGPSATCGTNAECTCNSDNQCGCTPSACLD